MKQRKRECCSFLIIMSLLLLCFAAIGSGICTISEVKAAVPKQSKSALRSGTNNSVGVYAEKKKSVVRKAAASITLNKSSVSLMVGKSFTLKAAVTGKSNKVSWTSSNSKIAAVSNGKVTGKAAGKVTITAKANGKTAKCTVKVTENYKKLYSDFLVKGKVNAVNLDGRTGSANWYYMVNIDKSGVPELVVSDGVIAAPGALVWITDYYVYTVKNNKVKYIGYLRIYDNNDISRPYLKYSEKYKGIVYDVVNRHGCNESKGIFQIKNSKLWEAYYAGNVNGYTRLDGIDRYYIVTPAGADRAQQVSKVKYQNYVKKYFSNVKKRNMIKNTAANRKKSFS